MKLKKREITLNEADSMQDMFRMEEALLSAYENGDSAAFRKETQNELARLRQSTEEEGKLLRSLWGQAKARQL